MTPTSFRKGLAATAILIASALASPQTADACSSRHMAFFEVEENPQEAYETPQQVSLSRGTITRGQDGESSACDDLASLELKVDPAEENTGYLFEVTDGDAPQFLHIDENRPVELAANGEISLEWNDGLSDDQEPLDFYMVVTPVNKAGDMGPTSEPLHITDPGTSSFLCAVTDLDRPVTPAGGLMIVLLGLFGWQRRR